MAGPKFFDRVRDTSTTTGTGTLTLANSAPAGGFRTFGSVLSSGDTCFYTASLESASEWEVGVGTYTSSGTTLARTTVLASSNSGSAVNFSAGVKQVFMTLPADFAGQHLLPTGAHAGLSAFKEGRLLFPTDAFALLRDSGSALVPWGPVFPLRDPNLETWSWENQGTASVVTTGSAIYLSRASVGASDSVSLYKKAVPSRVGGTWKVTAAILPQLLASQYSTAGLWVRESVTGRLTSFVWTFNNGISTAMPGLFVGNYTNTTTYAGSSSLSVPGATYAAGPVRWMRITDDNTNLLFQSSLDGQNFITLASVARASFLTTGADEVGIGVNPNSADSAMTLLSWKEN